MATEVVMPRLSDTMDSGTIGKWLKSEGDEVKRGDIIAEIETDKSNMELEAYATGILARIIVSEGESVALGEPIALIAANADEARQIKDTGSAVENAQATATEPSAPPTGAATEVNRGGSNGAAMPDSVVLQPAAEPASGESENQRIKASPLARRLAQEHGVELRSVTGTGPGGRITKEDVLGALQQGARAVRSATAPAVDSAPAPTPPVAGNGIAVGEGVRGAQPVELSRMQQTIARRMTESRFSAPEFVLTAEFDMTEARGLLRSVSGVEGAPKVGANDLLIKAVAASLAQHPEVNSGWENNTVQRYARVNVGFAVAIPGGLVVPVVRDADKKSLGQLAGEARELIEKSRTGKLAPGDYEGGTFTISNLGMFGIDQFTAILNPPEACIMGVGAITPKPVVIDGAVVVRERMRVSLSCDHRVINGAEGAQFLQTLRRLLEHPMLALI